MTGPRLLGLLSWIDSEMDKAREARRLSLGPIFTASAVSRLVALGQMREQISEEEQ